MRECIIRISGCQQSLESSVRPDSTLTDTNFPIGSSDSRIGISRGERRREVAVRIRAYIACSAESTEASSAIDIIALEGGDT
jgi:hypothetical protein